MRIAVVNNFFAPRAGGSSHMAEGLAGEFAAEGHEVLVITAAYQDAPADEVRDGYRVVRLPSWSAPETKLTFNYDILFTTSPGNWRRLSALLDEFRPDVVHQHGQFFDLTWMSGFWARRRGVPVVLSVHTRLVSPRSGVHQLILWLGDVAVVRPLARLGHPHVIVMDKLMDTYIRGRYGIAPDHLVPIRVAVDLARFPNADGRAVREELGIGQRPMVLSLGHVIPLRDRLGLVEALPHIVTAFPDLAVVVVGTIYDDRFLRRAEELGVADHLVLVGGVRKDDVPEFIAAADVECHDLQGYGLGIASLEAMAAGVPIVAALPEDHFPGVPLRSGENLTIVPQGAPRALADAITGLLADPVRAEQIGKAQQRLVDEHFAIEVIAREHLELFERVRLHRE